jgi:Amt family ammonium transporter
MRLWISLVVLTVLCGFVHTQNTTNVTTADPIAALQSDVKSVKRDMDKGFVMLCAFVIFFMQAGFAFVEAGSVRSKNVSNILLKVRNLAYYLTKQNLMNTSFCTMGWFVVGWGIAFGNRSNVSRNGFVGNGGFFLLDSDDDYHNWFFQWCFCVAAAMIAGGSVAERTNLSATFFFNFV